MQAQQMMGSAGGSQLVSSDSASVMWFSQEWCQFLNVKAETPYDWFNVDFFYFPCVAVQGATTPDFSIS